MLCIKYTTKRNRIVKPIERYSDEMKTILVIGKTTEHISLIWCSVNGCSFALLLTSVLQSNRVHITDNKVAFFFCSFSIPYISIYVFFRCFFCFIDKTSKRILLNTKHTQTKWGLLTKQSVQEPKSKREWSDCNNNLKRGLSSSPFSPALSRVHVPACRSRLKKNVEIFIWNPFSTNISQ